MMKLHLMFAVACIMIFPTLGKEIVGFVGSVIDGDTIQIHDFYGQYKVRLAGIDAPELTQAFGNEAASQLEFLIGSKEVRVEYTSTDRDGRILGIVYLGNADINHYLLRNGYAWHYKQYNNSKHYADAEALARSERIGLWMDASPIPPWEFRAGRKRKQQNSEYNAAQYVDYNRKPIFSKSTYGGFVQTSAEEKAYNRDKVWIDEKEAKIWGDFLISSEGQYYLSEKRMEKMVRKSKNGGKDPLCRMSEHERGQYYYNLGRRLESGEKYEGFGFGYDAVYFYRRAVEETKRKNGDAINALRRLGKWPRLEEYRYL